MIVLQRDEKSNADPAIDHIVLFAGSRIENQFTSIRQLTGANRHTVRRTPFQVSNLRILVKLREDMCLPPSDERRRDERDEPRAEARLRDVLWVHKVEKPATMMCRCQEVKTVSQPHSGKRILRADAFFGKR